MQRQEALAGKHSRQEHKGCSFNVRAALLAISVSCTHTSTHTCTHNVHIIYGVNQRAVALRMRPQKSTGIRHVAHTHAHFKQHCVCNILCVSIAVSVSVCVCICICVCGISRCRCQSTIKCIAVILI